MFVQLLPPDRRPEKFVSSPPTSWRSRASSACSGESPTAARLFNVLLVGLSAYLVWFLSRFLGASRRAAIIATLVFLVVPHIVVSALRVSPGSSTDPAARLCDALPTWPGEAQGPSLRPGRGGLRAQRAHALVGGAAPAPDPGVGRLDALAAGFAEARNGPAGHLRARFSARLRALAAAQSGPIREAGTDRYRGRGHLFPIHVAYPLMRSDGRGYPSWPGAEAPQGDTLAQGQSHYRRKPLATHGRSIHLRGCQPTLPRGTWNSRVSCTA